MARQKVTVYVVKYLFWCFDDNYTLPLLARFEKAFRSREKAELYRRELELAARGRDNPASEGDEPLETQWDEPRVLAWLATFGLSEPPRDASGRFDWAPQWVTQAESQLGRETFLRFCELFDGGSYFYHVVETEMEL